MYDSYRLKFYSDPGHGWLEVPHSLLVELGIAADISSFSYVKGDLVYLEEDCDAGTFLEAYRDGIGGSPSIEEVYQEDTPIRGYSSYRGN